MQKIITAVLRVLTTVLLIAGLLLVYSYIRQQASVLRTDSFSSPSYIAETGHGAALLVAGGCVAALAAMAAFLSWFRSMDTDDSILPNAGYSDREQIGTWLKGTTLDTGRKTHRRINKVSLNETGTATAAAEEGTATVEEETGGITVTEAEETATAGYTPADDETFEAMLSELTVELGSDEDVTVAVERRRENDEITETVRGRHDETEVIK